jgi:hypothetical protein
MHGGCRPHWEGAPRRGRATVSGFARHEFSTGAFAIGFAATARAVTCGATERDPA